MKIERVMTGIMAVVVLAGIPGIAASNPNAPGIPAQMVITVRPGFEDNQANSLEMGELTVLEGNTLAPVVGLQRLTGNLADMQIFVLLDDSTRSTSLGLQLPELKKFIGSLPSTTQVAVGYMRNGTFDLAQAFTADHEKAAGSLRLPVAIAGANGSPYFVLSHLAKHWPSKETTGRRAVLMLTDGVDRYFGTSSMDDPYVDAAIHDALKEGVMVYSIYLEGAGVYGRSGWVTNFGQSRLIEVSKETGGYAYFEGFKDPVTISPFLKDLENRLENQYEVKIQALNGKGIQPVKLRSVVRGLKIEGPTHIYVR